MSLRDLQWRRRRVLFAILATGLVLGMSLTMGGTERALYQDGRDIVGDFAADSWVVVEGNAGPFTTTRPLPTDTADAIAASPGVERSAPVVILHSTLEEVGGQRDVNVVGAPTTDLVTPEVVDGRLPIADGEAAVDEVVGAPVGATVVVAGRSLEVVGRVRDTTWYFGAPTLFVSLADAQALAFDGLDLATTVVTAGTSTQLPPGLAAVTPDEVVADLDRLMESSSQTLGILNGLLWLTAAGIIGLVVYLSALERRRDLAVLKATGAGTGALARGLVLQALVLTVAAGGVGVLVAAAMAPTIPFGVVIPWWAHLQLFGVALVIGAIASLAGLRQVVAVDPALAFGGG